MLYASGRQTGNARKPQDVFAADMDVRFSAAAKAISRNGEYEAFCGRVPGGTKKPACLINAVQAARRGCNPVSAGGKNARCLKAGRFPCAAVPQMFPDGRARGRRRGGRRAFRLWNRILPAAEILQYGRFALARTGKMLFPRAFGGRRKPKPAVRPEAARELPGFARWAGEPERAGFELVPDRLKRECACRSNPGGQRFLQPFYRNRSLQRKRQTCREAAGEKKREDCRPLCLAGENGIPL